MSVRDAVEAHDEKIVILATASQPVLQLPIVRCLFLRRQHPSCVGNRHLAALITSGGRLLVAMLEKMVTDAGANYFMCDTDSMAMIASKHGGLVP